MIPPRRPSEADADALTAEFNALITAAGGDPASSRGRNVREAMHAALKLVPDDATDGEAMLVSRSLKELRYALKVFRPYRGTRKISVFGSARTPEDHPDYRAAVDFSRQMAQAGWMVITGAGDGIMRAGHGGAGREASFGVSIRLPFETHANDVIVGDPKLIVFRYFFTRKLMFMWESHAIALFPGGFGTQDEGFEALTLIQTGKAPLVPLVMVDAPGQNYWRQWDAYVRSNLLDNGWISPEDLNLYTVTDDVEAASRHVMEFYRNYHSQRFVGDDLVLRLHRPLTAKQLDALEERFGVLIVSGGLRQSGPLEGERGEFSDLPRLSFHHTRHGYGHLRAMIDQINAFDAA